MLHAFSKRLSSSRFRRVATTRFPAVVPQITGEFKFNQTIYEHTRTLRRRRRLAQTLGRVAYLAPTWRELLMFRAASPAPSDSMLPPQAVYVPKVAADKAGAAYPHRYGRPLGGVAKRRFASLPTNAAFKQDQTRVRETLPTNRQQTHALRAALLRHALRRRRVERTIFDLRKHALTRRLAKDQLSPPWRVRKSARRRGRYAAVGAWGAASVTSRPATSGFWTLRHLGAVGPRAEDRAKTYALNNYYGEVLRLRSGVLYARRKG